MRARDSLFGMAFAIALGSPAGAFTAYVSNEKGNTITVIDTDKLQGGEHHQGRPAAPRHRIDQGRTSSSSSRSATTTGSQVVDTKTRGGRCNIAIGARPRTVRPGSGRQDCLRRQREQQYRDHHRHRDAQAVGEVQVGVEPEGMGISPDGKILVNTSETTNMAHFIDMRNTRIVANILVDARPRFAEYKQDGSELWVTSEVGGTVSVIDPVKHVVITEDHVRRAGPAKRSDPARRHQHHQDGKMAFVALGPANRIAVIDAATHEGAQISAGRPARLANGVHAGRQVSLDHERRLERRLGHRRGHAEGDQIDSGRFVPLGRRDFAAMTVDCSDATDEATRTAPALSALRSVDEASAIAMGRAVARDLR